MTDSKCKHSVECEHEVSAKKAKVDTTDDAATNYVPYIPNGYHALQTYLSMPMHQSLKAIKWYQDAFGATEIFKMMSSDGKQCMHAEIQFGTSRIMLSDCDPSWNPEPYVVGSATTVCFYTPDVDALYARALRHGAKSTRAPQTQFYGDRSAQVVDPFGFKWSIATHVKDVPVEEMQRLGLEMEKQFANKKQ